MSEAEPKLRESNKVCDEKVIKRMYDENLVKELYARFEIKTFGDSPEIAHLLELNLVHLGLRHLLGEKEYVNKFFTELNKLQKISFSYLDGPLDCLTFECMKSMQEKGVIQLGNMVILFPISNITRQEDK